MAHQPRARRRGTRARLRQLPLGRRRARLHEISNSARAGAGLVGRRPPLPDGVLGAAPVRARGADHRRHRRGREFTKAAACKSRGAARTARRGRRRRRRPRTRAPARAPARAVAARACAGRATPRTCEAWWASLRLLRGDSGAWNAAASTSNIKIESFIVRRAGSGTKLLRHDLLLWGGAMRFLGPQPFTTRVESLDGWPSVYSSVRAYSDSRKKSA